MVDIDKNTNVGQNVLLNPYHKSEHAENTVCTIAFRYT